MLAQTAANGLVQAHRRVGNIDLALLLPRACAAATDRVLKLVLGILELNHTYTVPLLGRQLVPRLVGRFVCALVVASFLGLAVLALSFSIARGRA